jgi:hypothetical protein
MGGERPPPRACAATQISPPQRCGRFGRAVELGLVEGGLVEGWRSAGRFEPVKPPHPAGNRNPGHEAAMIAANSAASKSSSATMRSMNRFSVAVVCVIIDPADQALTGCRPSTV